MSFLTASILIDGERIARVERSDLSIQALKSLT